jgi:hypothetical protein
MYAMYVRNCNVLAGVPPFSAYISVGFSLNFHVDPASRLWPGPHERAEVPSHRMLESKHVIRI